ncbi:hypothetical protein N4845_11245, partial [Enterococcus faecalis]|nr:hypothetical protein [Enterococcus faecalis]
MDFNQVNQGFISSVASKRNHIPRKSLNYQTPLEVFLSYVNDGFIYLSSSCDNYLKISLVSRKMFFVFILG